MITNVMMSNNLRPQTEAKQQFFVLEDSSPNIDHSNTKNHHLTGDSAEKALELALIQAEIFYCKPEQLIGSFEESPSFVIPKYKIAIVLSENLNLENKAIYHNWKVVSIDTHNINESIKNCIDYIQNQCEVINEQPAHLFTFVDLFAGIGGFRIPLEALGGKCLGFSEIDKKAIETYKNNFLDKHNPDELELGSVTNLGKLPFDDIDLIVGGVPCQSWSVAGKMRGFDDPRGKLWEDTIRIVELNQPKTFIFENVKGLIDPRNKENLNLIIQSFEKIGYAVKYKLLNSYDFGLPQNRERIYIVGIRNDYAIKNNFRFPSNKSKKSHLYEIIEGLEGQQFVIQKEKVEPKDLFGEKIPIGRNRFQKTDELNDFFVFCDTRNGHTTIHSWDMIETTEREKEICLTILKNRRKQKYGNADGNPLSYKNLQSLLPNLIEDELVRLIEKKILKFIEDKGYVFVNSKNSAGINGVYRIYLPTSNIFPTLTATGTKDMVALENIQGKTPEEFREKFISQIIKPQKYRPITAREAGKLQGFPDWFAFNKNERFAQKQFGNAVSTSVVYGVADVLTKLKIYHKAI